LVGYGLVVGLDGTGDGKKAAFTLQSMASMLEKMGVTIDQKDIQVKNVAAVMVTTNFALTYFIVSGEIEASRVPAWLLIKDSEGLSVLTAWAAGKFSGDDVGMFVKKSGIMDKVKHTELIIPGYAAAIAGDVEEELPGWTITVGPREAAHLPGFLRGK
jgi:CO dehydrogenase/acetyl-CoA synthase gamma subunit (corrinoid Fe-S protein)